MAKTRKSKDEIDRTVRKTALRAAIYARVSTDQQEEEGTSLDTQVNKAVLYCEARKYIVDPRFIYQETFTGMLYRERQILGQLREAMREGEFDVLVVYALDRLSRVQAHQVILLEELEHHNVKFESVTEEIDNSIEGQIIRSIMGIVAQVEHEKILERTERGRRSRAEDEKSMLGAGIATYGYNWNEKRTGYLIRDDLLKADANGIQWTEEKIVQRMFDEYTQGATIRAIASTLTNEKVPTRKGGEIWRPSTVSQILSNPIYTGKAIAFKWEVLERTNKDGHWKQRLRPDEEQVVLPDGVVPAIIDMETFEIVQRKQEQNKQFATRNNKYVRDALLRCGLVVCGHCGANMHVQKYKPTRSRPYPEIFYYCPNGRDTFNKKCKWTSITTTILDDAVWKKAIPLLEDFALVAQRLEKFKGKDPAAAELPPILRKLDDIDRRRNNFIKMLNGDRELDDETTDMIQEQLFMLGKEKKGVEAERRAVEQMRIKWDEVERKLERFRLWCIQMSGCLEEAPIDKKREALELLGVKAYVWRHDHDPRYQIDFAPVSIVAVPSQMPRHKREEKPANVSELHTDKPAQFLNFVSATLPLHIRRSIIAGSEQVDLR